MFLHAGWAHILGNMLYLWIFAPNLEDVMGPVLYTTFYLLCGLVASAAQIAIDPTSTLPNLGASGAIAGVIGGFIHEFPSDEIRVLVWSIYRGSSGHLQAGALIGLWFLLQFFSGIGEVATHAVGGGAVAFFAHLGGFTAGVVLVKAFVSPPPNTPRRHLAPPALPSAAEGRTTENEPYDTRHSLAQVLPPTTAPRHFPAHAELPSLI